MFIEPNLPMPICQDTYEKMAESWLKIIRYKESGVILFVPKMDRLRRVNQLISDKDILKKYLPDYKKTKFFVLNPDMINFDDESEWKKAILNEADETIKGDLKTVIKTLSKKYRLVFLIINAEKLFLEDRADCLASLAGQQGYNPEISILLLSEVDATNPKYFQNLTKYTVFCQNIIYTPLYDNEKDAMCYFSYLEKKWQIKVPEKLKKDILENIRHYWLVKEAVRKFRDNPKLNLDQILNNETMELKVRIFFESLLESEQNVLIKIALQKPITTKDEKHSLNYLLKMNIIKKTGSCLVNNIFILDKYIKKYLSTDEFRVLEGSVLLNGIKIDKFFSKKESILLKNFVEKKGKVFSREDIAKNIWGENYCDSYSDWTIDQTISRLRKKIKGLGISPAIIKTIKNQGFIFQ